MTNEQTYSIWAAEESFWSTWAKPVLFAHLDLSFEFGDVGSPRDASWAPAVEERTAIVLDLPGDEGVWVGLGLAHRGYRPVPLYNALPHPYGVAVLNPFPMRSVVAVNVVPVLTALRRGAEVLAGLQLPPYAPPVFLLDANRHGNGMTPHPGEFDNRSVSFTTDFPSANFLLAHGISRVLLVQGTSLIPHTDLAHILRRWQDGGLILERSQIESPFARETFEVPRPAWYRAMFQRVLAAVGLRRAISGGFGAWVPEVSAGG